MNTENIKEMIDRELDYIEPNLEEGWKMIEEQLDKKKVSSRADGRYISRITAAAIMLAFLIPVGSVAAYAYYWNAYKLPVGEQYIALEKNSSKADIEEVSVVKSSNLEIEWKDYTFMEDKVVMTFQIKTKDGSQLIMADENKAPLLFPLSFEHVQIGGEGMSKQFSGITDPYEWIDTKAYLGCTSIAEDYTSADFELSVEDSEGRLRGEKISIRLSNLVGVFHKFTDMNTTGTLGELLAGSPEGESLHITFSEEYPDCYIDSYEFVSDEMYENTENILHIYPSDKKIFTMTVVCDEESRNVIRDMAFQNVNTGFNGNAEMQVKELEDGRLRFYYSVNYDGSYVNETYPARGGARRDTTFDDLYHLVLKLGGELVTETVMEGEIEEIIVLK